MGLLVLVSGLAIVSLVLGVRALCRANPRDPGSDRPGKLRERFERQRGGTGIDATDLVLGAVLLAVAFSLGTCAAILDMMRPR